MSYVVTGHCPKCGSPIYSPMVWHAVIPPPATPSCNCLPRPTIVVRTTSGGFNE